MRWGSVGDYGYAAWKNDSCTYTLDNAGNDKLNGAHGKTAKNRADCENQKAAGVDAFSAVEVSEAASKEKDADCAHYVGLAYPDALLSIRSDGVDNLR